MYKCYCTLRLIDTALVAFQFQITVIPWEYVKMLFLVRFKINIVIGRRLIICATSVFPLSFAWVFIIPSVPSPEFPRWNIPQAKKSSNTNCQSSIFGWYEAAKVFATVIKRKNNKLEVYKLFHSWKRFSRDKYVQIKLFLIFICQNKKKL